MRRSLARGSALALGVLLLAGSGAQAQRAHVSLGGGLALPTDNSADNGFQLQGSVDVSLPAPALALRIDLQYDRFPLIFTPAFPCTAPGCVPQEGHARMIAGSINGVLQLPESGTPVTPYLVGGLGMYNHDSDINGTPSGSDIGVNAGGGLRLSLGAAHAFAEVRFHVVKNATNFVPLAVGLRF